MAQELIEVIELVEVQIYCLQHITINSNFKNTFKTRINSQKFPFKSKFVQFEHKTRFTLCSRVQPSAIPGQDPKTSPHTTPVVASKPNPHRTAQISTDTIDFSSLRKLTRNLSSGTSENLKQGFWTHQIFIFYLLLGNGIGVGIGVGAIRIKHHWRNWKA